jgi:transposase
MRGEVLTGIERRRRWSVAQKLAVVRASWGSGARVAEVARKFGVTRQQIYDWRAAARRGDLVDVGAGPGFVELVASAASVPMVGARMASDASPPDSIVEIGLPHGRSLRLPSSLPTAELRRLIRAVEGA